MPDIRKYRLAVSVQDEDDNNLTTYEARFDSLEEADILFRATVACASNTYTKPPKPRRVPASVIAAHAPEDKGHPQ